MESEKYSPVWQEKFTVRSFDIGMNARIRLNSICSYFQEIAGQHATHLGAGYRFMQETGRVWVLSKLFIDIKELPGWNHEIMVETWPLGPERIFFRREYRIKQVQETLITATSYWLLLDISTRRPVTFTVNEDVLKANDGIQAMNMPTDGFSPVSSGVKTTRRVVYSDLDQNLHVNNARYVAWILDCFDAGFHKNHTPSYFAIEYKHEVMAGEDVDLRLEQIAGEDAAFNVEGRIAGTDKVCLRSRIRFRASSI